MADLTIPSKPATKEECVNHVVNLMASGEYVTGRTCKDLSVAWGLSESSTRQITAEASRRIRAQIDTEDIRARVISTLETITQASMGKATSADTRNAIRALEALGRVIGTPRPTIAINGLQKGGTVQILMLPPEDPTPQAILTNGETTDESKASVEGEPGPSNNLLGE